MSMLILLVFLTGAVLGMRFKVIILVPAATIALFAIFAAGVALGHTMTAVGLTALLALVCLQIGYLGGLLTRYSVTMVRAAPLRAAQRIGRNGAVDGASSHHAGSRQTQYRA